MILHILSPSGLALGNSHLALLGLGRLLIVLMFLYVSQNSCFFAKFIKAAEGFFERFIIAYSNACQLLYTPFTAFGWFSINNIPYIIGMIFKYLGKSTGIYAAGPKCREKPRTKKLA
jgi:hypothetical protein